MYRIKKVVVIGPESTGKSTLCRQLADHYHTIWVEEYAREYLIQNGKDYQYEDLLEIAKGQVALEDDKFKRAGNNLLVIDTDLYVMKVWSEFVFNRCDHWILNKIAERQYDLYLLCAPDLPWVEDELREYPDQSSREKLYRYYKDCMIEQNVKWVEISGNYEDRIALAIKAVDEIL